MGDDLSGKLSIDTTDAKAALVSLNRDLRVMESGFRASAAGLGDWAKSATGLELRIKSLTSQIDVQKQKVSALDAEYKRIVAEKGATSKAAQELEIRLNKEKATLGTMTVELNKSKTSLSSMTAESSKAAKETDRLEKEEKEATSATTKFSTAIKGLGDKLHASVGGLGKMAAGVGKLAAGMAVGLVGAIGGAIAGLTALTFKVGDAADELVETAEKMGITTTRLQELNYVAEQTGTGVSTMQSSMSRMIRSLDDVEKAGTPAAEAFGKLGVSVRDSNGNLLDSEQIFFNAIAALGNVENATERDALAMEIFGRSALELNPLINLGADGLAAMSTEAHTLGNVMGEDAVAGLSAVHDSMYAVKESFKVAVGTILASFLPTMNLVIDFIQNTVIPWLQVNLPKAIQVLSDYWTKTLQPAIMQVWTWMSTVLIPFLQTVVFPWLQVNIPKAIQVLSDFWTGVLWPAIEAVWAWMSTVLIPFLRDTVKPWLDKNIPAALQVLSDFWTGVLQPAIDAVWSWMSTVLIPFLRDVVAPWLKEHIPAAIQTLSDFWNNTLLPAIQAVWEFIDTYLVPIFVVMQDIFKIGLKLAIEILAGIFQNVLLPAFDAVWSFVETYVTPALTWLMDKVIKPLTNSLNTGLKKALDWIVQKLQDFKAALEKIKLPSWLTPGSPTPFEMGIRGINDAMRELNSYTLPTLSVGLNRLQGSAPGGFGGQSSVQNSWHYTIQAANPLQSSDDLVRQVRLLELMHG